VEILKQGQYDPYPVENQIAIIFAGTNGYLDEIPLEEVERFEKEFLEMMELKHKDVLDEIAAKKDLSDEMITGLNNILKDFTTNFKVSIK
jgi:F-type H+-transporting ATPase subunit alpha